MDNFRKNKRLADLIIANPGVPVVPVIRGEGRGSVGSISYSILTEVRQEATGLVFKHEMTQSVSSEGWRPVIALYFTGKLPWEDK